MNPSTTAIFINILVYLIYVLVPMIPAIIIYKKFPETKVGATGVLGNLKINSTGAFAAYIIVVTLGYFIIQNIQRLNNASISDNTSWVIKSKVIFYDQVPTVSGPAWQVSKNINDDSVKYKLNILATPDYSAKDLDEVVFFMSYFKDGLSRVTYSYPGYISQVRILYKDSVDMDYENRTINVGNVELRQLNQAYSNETVQQPNPVSSFPAPPDFKTH
jgi:hypothetical protein